MNGMSKQTWCALWKPEFQTEAGAIYDALNDIHTTIQNQPPKCQKKFVSRTQMIIFVLAIMAAGNLGLPFILKILGL